MFISMPINYINMKNFHLTFLSFVLLGIIFVSGCTQQTSPAMIACLNYVELQDNFNSSNLVFAEYDYDRNKIMSSPFELSDYQVDDKIIKAGSCYSNITLVLVSRNYIEKENVWVEGLWSSPEMAAEAIRHGFKTIYKCRSDRHKEWYDLTFEDEIEMTIPGHENENWYCIPINSPSII